MTKHFGVFNRPVKRASSAQQGENLLGGKKNKKIDWLPHSDFPPPLDQSSLVFKCIACPLLLTQLSYSPTVSDLPQLVETNER